MTIETILSAIGSTEPSNFFEFLKGLGADCPEKGDRDGYRELFNQLKELERNGLVDIERRDGQIEWLQLTEAGANSIRAYMDSKRPLLGLMQ